jgi:DMSO/TMAO reductase YedYZ molybdopterin-dependent catalytic subunit
MLTQVARAVADERNQRMSERGRPGAAGIGRRDFLAGAAAAAVPLLAGGRAAARAPKEELLDGLIVRERGPDNLEFPFATLDGFRTPAERFYVRNHFAAPRLDAKTWKLKVAGAVGKELELSYDDLLALPSKTVAVTLECAGNGRSFLSPKSKGVQWSLGAVGTAEWTGVPLAAVLDRAGVRDKAVDVVLEGGDRGEPKNEPKPSGPLPFARGLPLAKALKPEVLLAYKMNGGPLPPNHGSPVRAVVGGWYGMASVKWLTRVVVTDRPFLGYDQTVDYAYWDRSAGVPSLTPITEIQVKASIARPAAGEAVPAGADYRVRGAAWAGESEVARVEVSTDGGKTWGEATLLGEPVPLAWRLWEFAWKSPAPGKHRLVARATDRRGRTQPAERDPDRRNYMINHLVATEVEVVR